MCCKCGRRSHTVRATRTPLASCQSAPTETTSWTDFKITPSKALQGCLGNTKGATHCLLQEVLLEVIDVPFGDVVRRKVWGPIGATTEAKWAVDNAGHERNYACFLHHCSRVCPTGPALAGLRDRWRDSGPRTRFCAADDHPYGPPQTGRTSNITAINCGWAHTMEWLSKACKGFMVNTSSSSRN